MTGKAVYLIAIAFGHDEYEKLPPRREGEGEVQ